MNTQSAENINQICIHTYLQKQNFSQTTTLKAQCREWVLDLFCLGEWVQSIEYLTSRSYYLGLFFLHMHDVSYYCSHPTNAPCRHIRCLIAYHEQPPPPAAEENVNMHPSIWIPEVNSFPIRVVNLSHKYVEGRIINVR